MDKELFERAWHYGKTAMGLLKRSRIPATPPFYDLLYTYASGVNPELNARINAILEQGNTPDSEVAEQLHDEFLQQHDMGAKLNFVSTEMAARIDAVHGAIDNAFANANSYSGLLQSAAGDLEAGLDDEAIARLTAELLRETRTMQDASTELESKLETARDDITALQRELYEVRRESMIDALTRIQNRKSFDIDIANAVADAEKSGDSLSLLLIDIDNFKAFNDSHGHQAGDQVLRLVANVLREGVHDTDTAARYGGEEFAIILPKTELKIAKAVAERLRSKIEVKKLHKRSTNENLGSVTASIGVATFRGGDTVTSLIERADVCLYAAKRNGRNRVVDEDSKLISKKDGKTYAA